MSRVAVTGAAGFIAGHIVAQLLEKGYHVVGTVRSRETAAYLWNLPHAKERLELVEVDLLGPVSAFVPCFKGCYSVIHTASPFSLAKCHPDELMKPAVDGTLNVLRACAEAKSVFRVIITSSFATMIFGHDHTTDKRPYTEHDFNELSRADSPNTIDVYRASKVMAERAARDFQRNEGSGIEIISLHPPLVVGPWLPGYTRPNESSMRIKQILTTTEAPTPGGMGIVDVRDVARAHVLSLTSQPAYGRYLLASHSFYWSELEDFLGPLRGASVEQMEAAASTVFGEVPDVVPFKPYFDCQRAKDDLGWTPEFTPAATLVAQCVALKRAGLV